jgi:EKC/KEOPS complex subunit CGI121/TPRKB
MALESIRLEHVAETTSVHAALFTNVGNSDFLQSQLLARNSEFEYAFIDVTSVSSVIMAQCRGRLAVLALTRTLLLLCQILSRRQLLAATFKAISLLQTGNLRTPNVHSEIVTSLSPSNNVHTFTPSTHPSGPPFAS